MSKHTSGPWTLHKGQWADHSEDRGGGFHIRMADFDDGGGWPGFLVEMAEGEYEDSVGYDEIEANARLIAAAPDLLHALQVILYDKSISAWLREHDPKALYQVEDAVTKATGGAA